MTAAVAGPAAPPARAPDVPFATKLLFATGAIAYGIKDNGFSVFLLIFYNQVVGLSAEIVGLLLLAALVVDALFDPMVGHLSDRTRSRWGRRHPWLYASALPIAAFWLLLWSPPANEGIVAYLWMFGCAVAMRISLSLNEVPSVALVPDMTGDPHERTTIFALRYLFGWAGGLVILFLAYGMFDLLPATPDKRGNFATYALAGSVVMLVTVLISALGTHRRYAQPMPADAHHPGLADMLDCTRFRPFRILLLAVFFGFAAQGVNFALSNYMLSFVWRLEGSALQIYAAALGSGVLTAMWLSRYAGRRWGKAASASILAPLAAVIGTLPYWLYLLRLFPATTTASGLALFLGLVAIATALSVSAMVLGASLMADVASAHRRLTGRAQEGVFTAGQWFMIKCVTGIGIFVAGQILALAAFPRDAVPGSVAQPVLDGIAFGNGAALLLLGLCAGATYRFFRLPE